MRLLLLSDPGSWCSGTRKHLGHLPGLYSAHGGSSNAWTDYETTTYFLDVEAAWLGGALERFSGFFRSPLLKESSLKRELKARTCVIPAARQSQATVRPEWWGS